MRKIFLLSLWFMLLAAIPAAGQCIGGSCRLPDVRIKEKEKIKLREPTPAWRYERAVGHRAAVVRVVCQDSRTVNSIGSGVIVRWGKRVVVLTARHVVRDAKRVWIILHTKKRIECRVIKVDVTWDCAVLLPSESIEQQFVAEVELGEKAMFREGDRLESCGYGADGKLAANSGLFRGYRRSTAVGDSGPDDWLILSGHARQGDSGGPIFNADGHVVGILWGTDGEEVVGVQAGRLHLLLDEAVAALYEQRSYTRLQYVEVRRPTPPKVGPLTPVPQGNAANDGKAILPWREGTEQENQDQDRRISRLIEAIERQQAALAELDSKFDSRLANPGRRQSEQEAAKACAAEPQPLPAGLCILCGVVLGFVIYFANEKGTANE